MRFTLLILLASASIASAVSRVDQVKAYYKTNGVDVVVSPDGGRNTVVRLPSQL